MLFGSWQGFFAFYAFLRYPEVRLAVGEIDPVIDSNGLKKPVKRHKTKIAKSSENESGKAFAGTIFERVNDGLRVFGLKNKFFF